ncbi:cation-dependent mannose-6-phosphate receptor [Rhypophila sp. PSN 637]
MQLKSTHNFLGAVAVLASVTVAEDGKFSTTPTATATACVATSTSGAFFDLRPDTAVVIAEGEKPGRGVKTEDYLARGYDYGYNFTLNICGAVVKGIEDVVGVDKSDWKNISAYYEEKGKVYSLGQQSGTLTPRGRKLVLQYSNGSPCGGKDKEKDKRRKRRTPDILGSVHEGAANKYHDYPDYEDDDYMVNKDDDDDEKKDKKKDKEGHRKSATISFLCDHDPEISTTASFVSADPDECAYFFEVRSQHACATAEPHKPGSVGPGSVFAIIFFIAVLVYIVGGIFYQRTVAHARGWRQLPNYSLWAGIWSFISDTFIILTSSCSRLMPSRRGYRSLQISPNGRGRTRDDENRLIDQLDEEWDD